MNFILGIIVGGLIVAYYPEAGVQIRALTNTAAAEVEQATAEQPQWQELYRDTVEALAENSQ